MSRTTSPSIQKVGGAREELVELIRRLFCCYFHQENDVKKHDDCRRIAYFAGSDCILGGKLSRGSHGFKKKRLMILPSFSVSLLLVFLLVLEVLQYVSLCFFFSLLPFSPILSFCSFVFRLVTAAPCSASCKCSGRMLLVTLPLTLSSQWRLTKN